ncbi:MAG: hypothetical protein FWE43_01465 [Streptococcaceae bacterium]|nr:hypothetical protein [Streptococcaceae bacterium]MCL2681145.1 hypothetical protein [Streptococcaceae bacterium]
MKDDVKLPLHTIKSIGYINVITALNSIFGEKYVIKESYQYTENGKDWYDDFRLIINYHDNLAILTISDTRTEGMMYRGAGGAFSIFVKSLDTEGWAPYIDKNGIRYDGLDGVVSSEESDYLKYDGSHGNNAQAIEKSLQILKKYLDNHGR